MKSILIMISLLLAFGLALSATSIYEIQYTGSRGADGSYPSPYLGRIVTIDGIITAADYMGGGYFLSEPTNGAWRGILVYDRTNSPKPGTYLRITGEVTESFGMTAIQNVSNYVILDSNRQVPKPISISTGQLSNSYEAEAFEGVLVRMVNATSSSNKTRSGNFTINDGSGTCSVNLNGFSKNGKNQSIKIGTQYSLITGVVVFGFGEYSVNPTQPGDLQTQQPVSVQNRSWGKIKSIYR